MEFDAISVLINMYGFELNFANHIDLVTVQSFEFSKVTIDDAQSSPW